MADITTSQEDALVGELRRAGATDKRIKEQYSFLAAALDRVPRESPGVSGHGAGPVDRPLL